MKNITLLIPRSAIKHIDTLGSRYRVMMMQETNLCGRLSLMPSIIPREGSMRVYKELIMAITKMSQLEGLAG